MIDENIRDINRNDMNRDKRDNRDNDNKVLYYLDELSGYRVASDDKDIRGWKVVDNDNRTIGEVDNLLVNKNTERVVYLDVEVDDSLVDEVHRTYKDTPVSEGIHEFKNEEGENHLIIPVGVVNIDESNKKVKTSDLGIDRFMRTKWISKGTPIDRDYEVTTLKSYFPNIMMDDNRRDNNFYNRREFLHGRF